MRVRRGFSAVVAGLTVLGTSATAAGAVVVATSAPAMAATSHHAAASHHAATWAAESRKGNVKLRGQIPVVVMHHNSKAIEDLGRTPASYSMSLNFGLPLRHKAALNRLIAYQGKHHTQMSRAEIYRKFSPNAAQYSALKKWLTSKGFRITHIGRDRTMVTAKAKTSVVEHALKTQVRDYVRRGYTSRGLKIAPYVFFSNSKAPSVPARLGLQSITGLTDMDRFFTDIQLNAAAAKFAASHGVKPNTRLAIRPNTRSGGGYYPEDIRAMYDEAGHGYDATGQTVGFTLWGAGETQKAMTDFSNDTGDTLITVDPACVGNGTPYQPSSCTTQQEQPNHLVTILENGNDNGASGNFEYDGNDETGLDIEQAHGTAPGAGMKYYDADCQSSPPAGSGLSNAGCNGSDVGLEDAMEDSSDDPTLHSVSDSWGIGGDAEYGLNDPFYLATENSLAIGAAAGTTHWDGTGDSGTEEAGYPADSQYAVGVGGTGIFSSNTLTSSPSSGPATLSTELTWDDGGSWCAPTEPRPSWQTAPNLTARASCPNRVVPDLSAIADTSTSVFEVATTGFNTTTQTYTDSAGGVGGTSVAGPELNGMEAVTENFVAAQTYSGAAPTVGFEGPMIYQLGDSSHANSYFRDVLCGNTASPIGGPDGDAALPGWDAATGFGAPDWFNYSTGYAIALGATNLQQPASISNNYAWTCVQTPGNAAEHGISMGTNSVGYAVGATTGTPWAATFMPSGAWGATNTFYKTTDGGQTWQTTNSDMLSIACTSTTTCVEVGDGGRIRRTTDSGTTWTYMTDQFNKALTQVACPSSSVCYAAGARGVVLKSTDGGVTWSFTSSADNNPIYGMSCPSTSVCYTTDIYAHIMKTINGGSSWALETTPVTTPDVNVPGSGGPNPFAGLFGISCTTIANCVAVGGFPPSGTDAPIVVTTDGGNSWTLKTSNAGTTSMTTRGVTTQVPNDLAGVTCVGSTCYAVGRSGTIVESTDGGNTWARQTSNLTTTMLNDITCTSASVCIATGQGGTVDVLNGGTWTPTTGIASSNFLSGVACVNATHCYTAGKQGATVAFDWTNVSTSAVLQAGGGTTQLMNSISCVDASHCVAVGAAGSIVTTSNAGLTWLPSTSGTTVSLTGVACNGVDCEAVGAATGGAAVILGSTNSGSTWTPQTSGTPNGLTGIACSSASSCVAVGAAGTILSTSNGGTTWTPSTSGTTTGLTAVACPTASNCYAVGAVASGHAVILASTNGGSSWAPQTDPSITALATVSCANATSCFAGGTSGSVVSTVDGGNTWLQQGNPINGPTNAPNPSTTSTLSIFGSTCTATRCSMGMGADGNMLSTKLLTVTVTASGPYGTTPNLTGLSPNDPSISYSPSSEANNVTGTLTCTTTATGTSDAGSYPVSECSGLSDNGFSVVYDLADSSYTVGKTGQTITFPQPADVTFGDPDFTLEATASSMLPVSYSSSTPDNCSVDPNSGDVTILGAGECTITASQSGSNDYTAAADVTQSFNIAKEDQTIQISTTDDKTFGDSSFEVDATATSELPVSLEASPDSTCTIDSDTSPANVTITGSGTCTITADQDGNDNYNAAPERTDVFQVSKANQTITFGSLPDETFGDPDSSLTASATSELTVTFTASGSCSIVAGPKVHLTGAGTCTVTAHQAGDSNYNPAPDVMQQFNVAKEAQTINFGTLPTKTFGSPDFTVSATATSNDTVTYGVSGDCTIHGATVHLVQVGSCTVTASQSGDSNYLAATPVSRTFNITQASQTINFAALPDKTFGSPDFTVSATATSGDQVSFAASGGDCSVSGSTVHLISVGTCTITASRAADANYQAAPDVTQSFTIDKATPTVQITASPTAAKTGQVTYSVSVSGVAGTTPTGSVTVSDGTNPCTITLSSGGGSCSLTETAGTDTITASYHGDTSYTTAAGTISETIGKATPAISFTSTPAKGSTATQKITYKVSLTGNAGIVPTGTVTVHDGKGNTCSGTLGPHGNATCSTTETKGTRTITATYNGDSNYTTATTTHNIKVG